MNILSDEQRVAIMAAAAELARAMTVPGCDFEVRVERNQITRIEDTSPRYAYRVDVLLREIELRKL